MDQAFVSTALPMVEGTEDDTADDVALVLRSSLSPSLSGPDPSVASGACVNGCACTIGDSAEMLIGFSLISTTLWILWLRSLFRVNARLPFCIVVRSTAVQIHALSGPAAHLANRYFYLDRPPIRDSVASLPNNIRSITLSRSQNRWINAAMTCNPIAPKRT